MINNGCYKESNELTKDLLKELLNDEIYALIIKGYINEDLCRYMTKKILSSKFVVPHPHEIRQNDGSIKYLDYGVDRIGISYHETYGKVEGSKEYNNYYSNRDFYMRELRSLAAPYQYPMDKFRLDMDDKCSVRVNLGAFDKNKMFCGVVRIMNAEKSILVEEQPHFDSLPGHKAAIQNQYAVNIYLHVPDKEGELELWSVNPLSNLDIDSFDEKDKKDWRSLLPKSFLIKPEVGDAIIFNTRRPHAVRSFSEGKRISIQSFLGVHKNKDISIWV